MKSTDMDGLAAVAQALRAVNTAKHKSAGKTHRIEIRVHGAKGVCEVKVFYVATDSPIEKAVQLAVQSKSRVLSDFEIDEL